MQNQRTGLQLDQTLDFQGWEEQSCHLERACSHSQPGYRSIDLLDIGLDGTTVTIDPSLEYGSPEKFKVAFYPNSGGIDGKTRLGYSSDGIHWNLYHDGYPVTERAADTNNQILWNPQTKRYLLHCRQDFEGAGGIGEYRGVRIMEHSKENDLLNHPTAWKTLTTFVLDDPDTSIIPGTKTPVYQIHTFPMWYYEGVWFGLTDILAATNKHVTDGDQDYHTSHERGVWEFYMAPSRDAVQLRFQRSRLSAQTPYPARGHPAVSTRIACVRHRTSLRTTMSTGSIIWRQMNVGDVIGGMRDWRLPSYVSTDSFFSKRKQKQGNGRDSAVRA